jgi:PAS domain S-box-containing protein
MFGGTAMEGKAITPAAAEVAMGERELVGRQARGSRREAGDQVFEHAPLGIQELDAELRILRANPAFCRMTGWAAGELAGQPLAELLAEADEAATLAGLLDRRAGVARLDLRYVRRDGALLPARVTATAVAGARRILAMVEDAGAATVDAGAGARTDVVDVLAAAVAEARDAADEAGVAIGYAYASEPLWVHADAAVLRHELDQLLASAVQAVPAGSLAVRCTASGGEALLEVLEVAAPDAAGADLAVAFATAAGDPERRITLRLPLARG